MRFFIITLIYILLIGCGKVSNEVQEQPFIYRTKQKIDKREIKKLTPVDSLNLDSLGLFIPAVLYRTEKGIVFFDRSNRTIVNTDTDLKIINKFELPEGRGPGELGSLRRFDYKEGKLLFIDNGLNKITHYSLKGDFINEFKVSEIPNMEAVKMISNQKYLIPSTFLTDSLYHLIDSEGNIINRIQSSKEVENPMMFTAQSTVSGKHLYVAGYSEPLIKKYNIENGALIFSKEIVDSYETTDSYMSFSNGAGFTKDATYGSIAIAIESGLFYSARYHNGENEYKFVDVYDEDSGEYEFSYVLKNYINMESLAVTSSHIYTIETNSDGENLLTKYVF